MVGVVVLMLMKKTLAGRWSARLQQIGSGARYYIKYVGNWVANKARLALKLGGHTSDNFVI